MILDPRVESAKHQLRSVRAVYPVMSVKGGVGKSTLTVMLSLVLRELGFRVGVLDTDLSNPSLHYLYGLEPRKVDVEEDEGYVPPLVHDGIRLSSPVIFTEGGILPARDKDSVNAVLELLAITNWRDVDVVIIDTPPGIHDEQLRLLKLMSGVHTGIFRPVIVTTPFKVSLANVSRSLDYINSLHKGEKILVINKHRGRDELSMQASFKCVLRVPWDERLDERLVSLEELLQSKAHAELRRQVHSGKDCFF